MTCSKCNNTLPEAATSCSYCGADVVQTQNSSAESSPRETSANVPELTFVEKMATSGKLASAQAKLEKLKRLDLQTARKELGEAAFAISFEHTRLTDHYDAIRKFGEQIESLRKATPPDLSASVLEKAKGHAQKGKQALEIEALNHKRKNAFCEIGRLVEDSEMPPESIAPFLQRIKAIKAEISKLEGEIEHLKSRVSGVFARPGRVLAVAAAIIVLFIAWSFVKPRYENWKQAQEVQRHRNLADAATIKLEAERKRLELENLERRDKMEQDARMKEAERNQQSLAQEIKKKEADRARAMAATNEAEERRLEQERIRMVQTAEQSDSNRKKIDAENRARESAVEAQKNRASLAARLLGEVELAPKVTLSGELQKLGANIEMRGENYEKLTNLQKRGEWLDILSCLDEGKLTEYPESFTIESLTAKLQKSNFAILLNGKFQETDSDRLYLVTFPIKYNIVTVWPGWERHPDGIGYLQRWSPKEGPVVVVSGNYKNVGADLNKFEVEFSREQHALSKKKELGEISDDELKARLETLRTKAYQTISQWALGR